MILGNGPESRERNDTPKTSNEAEKRTPYQPKKNPLSHKEAGCDIEEQQEASNLLASLSDKPASPVTSALESSRGTADRAPSFQADAMKFVASLFSEDTNEAFLKGVGDEIAAQGLGRVPTQLT